MLLNGLTPTSAVGLEPHRWCANAFKSLTCNGHVIISVLWSQGSYFLPWPVDGPFVTQAPIAIFQVFVCEGGEVFLSGLFPLP